MSEGVDVQIENAKPYLKTQGQGINQYNAELKEILESEDIAYDILYDISPVLLERIQRLNAKYFMVRE